LPVLFDNKNVLEPTKTKI